MRFEVDVTGEEINALFDEGEVDLEAARDLPCHTGVRLLGGTSSALGRVTADGGHAAADFRGRTAWAWHRWR